MLVVTDREVPNCLVHAAISSGSRGDEGCCYS